MNREEIIGRTQVKEVDFIRQTVYSIHIGFKICPFFREMFSQGADKSLLTFLYMVGCLVLSKVETVRAIIVNITQMHLICNAEILTNTIDITPRTHPTDDMHTRIELHSKASEVLKSTASSVVLLQNSDLKALTREDSTRKESTQSTTNYHSCLHSLASFICS